MNFLCRCCLLLFLSSLLIISSVDADGAGKQHSSAEDYLYLGSTALSEDDNSKAIDLYEKGIAALKDDGSESIITILSLETNLATAYSAIGGDVREKIIEHYEKAISAYDQIDPIDDKEIIEDAKSIASQSYFFYGMVLQDMEGTQQKSLEMYAHAVVLDPNLWAAWGNLGAVFHDHVKNYDEALNAYNKAYDVLTEQKNPTDPPADPKPILSQLQYRIGLCLTKNPDRKCALEGDPQTPVSCKEMANHAYSLAVQYDPDNESAKHMLATLTADATMKRASNKYVKDLFDRYAHDFEHSLVEELGYDGYARLRRGFDRAFGGRESLPTFSKVVDAGCGTGLVGEQFRNISSHLIGVDLSEAILDEAERLRPNLYNERIVGDITEVFRRKKPISLIVAADSFIYFGDLDPLFDAIEDGLDHEAYIAFTLENTDAETESTLNESKPDWRWQLTASGRFAHRKEYATKVGLAHGLTLIHYEKLDGFRHDHGKDVRGHLFVMQKGSSHKKDEL
ncbi:S-adenosyl-L-methionine-dependent methyltransferase [Fragilariopsis cylindrus CCMP1102]|uniref:S-adenosyl-L-methionine-dependent methyltransferase n=1 Tax=Fragilariopsis cylindrus CCMP1102 TaxID=635003 RepID=A0A1E7EUC8_9STRA|nr:S-adenosyl-L-methionine-dependent methyltransferase [Fragilariopsis cylindrus CCMP1102]|eukprot:OEU09404.1 S-adenosyl-L-methionine-dependent methyltransferase [Fragilariopsis cylindrus CCMP1102]